MNIAERCGFCLEEISKHLFKVPCNVPKQRGVGPDSEASTFGLAFSILKERNEVNDENRRLRKLLWLIHGHQGLYGDDGEMQCGQCQIDYKRDPIETIESKRWDRGIRQLNENEILRGIVQSLVTYSKGIGLLQTIIERAQTFFKDRERK